MIAAARWAAFEVLRAVETGDDDLPNALSAARETLSDSRDQALVTELTTGTLRWRAAIDHVVAHHARRPVTALDPQVRETLRLGAYQLLYLDRVPARAAVHDAVEIAKRTGLRSAAGFVNAVLRAIDRERGLPPWPSDPGPDGARDAQLAFLSITLSHPSWLVERWLDRYGYDATREWLTFNNQPAPVTLRVNTLVATPEEVAADLAANGVSVDRGRYVPVALVVRQGNPLGLPLAATGRFFAQDEASQLVGHFADARPGDRVLDACAAPGGKTLVMAGAMGNRGLLVAMDVRDRRLALLRRHVRSSSATSVRVVRASVLRSLPFGPSFDLVLLDAPCSGLGTVRRDPDVRWRRAPGDLATFADRQVDMLDQASRVVAQGGRLVYATCSSEPDENDAVVARFLARHPDFHAASRRQAASGLLPSGAHALDERGCLRTTPWQHGLEAFYAAMLVKGKHL